MIAVGTDPQDPQLDSSIACFPPSTLGDELPSWGYDLSDLSISSSDIDHMLLQNAIDTSLPFDDHTSHMHQGPGASEGSYYVSSQSTCDLASLFVQDSPRPRDLNLSFPGENTAPPFFQASQPSPVPSGNLAGVTPGNVTPTFSGGVTPKNLSRASSPAWSESSGNMSTSSVSGSQQQRGNSLVPRHKRPSHKRAEIKRRDKIKTYLDDVKEQVPSLRDKGKQSESAILTKAAEYVHHLKDGYTERGKKAAELRREIECLSTEIHSFQENLPAAGLREETTVSPSLDALYQQWRDEKQHSNKFVVFRSITSGLFDTFKAAVAPALTQHDLEARAQQWQSEFLALPVLRKQMTHGLRALLHQQNIVVHPDTLKLEFNSSKDSGLGGCSS